MDEKFRKLQRDYKSRPSDASKAELDEAAKRIGRYRQMSLKFMNEVVYQSTFMVDTGTLVRVTEENIVDDYFSEWDGSLSKRNHSENSRRRDAWRGLYGTRQVKAFSPVPETIDIAINSWCNFGCKYCYTDATTRGKHAPISLVEKTISSLNEAPYQIAYGGGSPTQHPEFIKILEKTRELGSVPNYTTEGQNLTDEILAATQATCGGVALTFHAARGIDYFKSAYLRLRNKLGIQLNVHVLADRNVVNCLNQLRSISSETGNFNIVLLAYYSGVGRSDESGLITKNVYMSELPEILKPMIEEGHRIAFSEGLIPYFLSRPEIGISTDMMIPMEGYFSCFINENGRMSHSSFDPPKDSAEDIANLTDSYRPTFLNETVYGVGAQELWNNLHQWPYSGHACNNCAKSNKCSVPKAHHYLICKYAEHNDPRSQPKKKKRNSYFGDED